MKTVYFVLPQYETGKKVTLSGVTPPTGPTYLYTHAKAKDFGKYNDGVCKDFAIHSEAELLEQIDSTDLICITTTISNYNNSIAFAKKAKAKGAKIALGGPWASVKSNQIAAANSFIDHIVVGEGELALEQILTEETSQKIVKTPSIPLCSLSTINLSGWSMADLQKYQENYRTMLQSGAYGPMSDDAPFFLFYQSARGCIQKPRCGFCGSRLGNKYVTRDAEQFYTDIESIVRQLSPINKKVHIFDCADSFTSGIDRLSEYKSFPGVTFTVFGRADEITSERAEKLRKLGITKVSMGIETGSDEMMQKIGKNIAVGSHVSALALLKEQGISAYVNLIYGLPGEKREDLEKTVRHFQELADSSIIYRVGARIATPLPNSAWYFDLLKKIAETNPILKERIHASDSADVQELIKLWLTHMTNVSFDDVHAAHSKLVAIAKKAGISISSTKAEGVA